MPETISKSRNRRTIGGVFATRDNADKAVEAFLHAGVSEEDIHVIVSINDTVRAGRVRIDVHNVKNPAPIIEIFDNHKAEYNLDGSRNFRQDVAGLTIGTAAGATSGGVTGTFVAGPVGTAVGAATGAVVGGGLGSVIGKAKEYLK
jgi:uncharacterized membrane protein